MNMNPFQPAIDRAMRAEIPLQTESYSPVPHSIFIDSLAAKLIQANYTLENMRMYSNLSGTQVVGFYDVFRNDDLLPSDFGFRMSIGFKNSYDKSMTAALAIGAKVIICQNGMISGDLITFKRKHTGTIMQELQEKIQQSVQSLDSTFARLVADANIMANYELTQRQKAEILGVMYFEEELVTPRQLSIVKEELDRSQFFKGDSLWDLYNHVTVALKTSPARRYIEDHIRLHDFMSDIAGISHVPLTEEVQEMIAVSSETVKDSEL